MDSDTVIAQPRYAKGPKFQGQIVLDSSNHMKRARVTRSRPRPHNPRHNHREREKFIPAVKNNQNLVKYSSINCYNKKSPALPSAEDRTSLRSYNEGVTVAPKLHDEDFPNLSGSKSPKDLDMEYQMESLMDFDATQVLPGKGSVFFPSVVPSEQSVTHVDLERFGLYLRDRVVLKPKNFQVFPIPMDPNMLQPGECMILVPMSSFANHGLDLKSNGSHPGAGHRLFFSDPESSLPLMDRFWLNSPDPERGKTYHPFGSQISLPYFGFDTSAHFQTLPTFTQELSYQSYIPFSDSYVRDVIESWPWLSHRQCLVPMVPRIALQLSQAMNTSPQDEDFGLRKCLQAIQNCNGARLIIPDLSQARYLLIEYQRRFPYLQGSLNKCTALMNKYEREVSQLLAENQMDDGLQNSPDILEKSPRQVTSYAEPLSRKDLTLQGWFWIAFTCESEVFVLGHCILLLAAYIDQ